MHTRPYRARVYNHERGQFAGVRNSNVLFYWPHGFGDWVQFSSVIPYLERTNRYWMTRFGDDNTALMLGHRTMQPVFLGINSSHCGDGQGFNNRHFGLEYSQIDGSEMELQLPLSLYEVCQENEIDTVFWSSYPETWGGRAYPYHTKPRNLLSHLVDEKTLQGIDLSKPLRSSVNFEVPAFVSAWVESRLRNLTGFGQRKLCIIGRNGYTSIEKNWGHLFREDMPESKRREGEECRDFMQLLLRKDPNWMFLIMEDRLFEGEHTARAQELHAYSYAELFGTPETSSLPFGLVLKALTNLASLAIGVPAGPYHLSMAKPGLPTIGLWINHLPSWYDEPKAESLHLISKNVTDKKLDERPGSFFQEAGLEYRAVRLESRVITGEQVLGAVEELVY